jgi:hypothetical protein
VLDVAIPNTGALFLLRDFRSLAAISVRREAEFMRLASGPSDREVNATYQYPQAIDVAVLSLASVKYVVASTKTRRVPAALTKQGTVGGVVFYENPQALPRFRIVHDVIPAGDEVHAFASLKALLDGRSAANGEWSRVAVIEGIAATDRTEQFVRPSEGEFVRREAEPDPETIVLEARLNRPGYVLVSDTFYPGWTATVDDAPKDVHPADLLFRAVAVPSGRHKIVMRYASPWLSAGEILSVLGLLLALLLIAGERLRRRIGAGERAR